MTQIHWFPGHMKKALNNITEKIKLVDVVIEILDARAPLSSMNPDLEQAIKHKKRLAVLSKADLADPEQTKLWSEELKKEFDAFVIANLTDPKSTKIISEQVSKLGEEKHQKEKAKGMKPQPIKAMIIGIPNVGKSSLINRVANRKAAGVQNKPGYTRGEQFIKVNNDFILLDTPGVLPMNYDDKKRATNIALLGSIREDILPNDVLVKSLLYILREYYPLSLKERYGIEEIKDDEAVKQNIATRRGLLTMGELDIKKAEIVLLKDFKDGKLGRITLDRK
ncbi:MAG: ribosome biogenesis GTPase YlqF [Bacilli bacterium]|nr:ribosome biogenesis GTPase YlqF [Bacilli bacterium]